MKLSEAKGKAIMKFLDDMKEEIERSETDKE
jgi:preprotein translocase subunit SecE